MSEKVKIVVLDGYTLNPGDLSWDALGELGEVTVYDRTDAAEVVERARGAKIVLTNKTCLGRSEMERLEGLGYIGVLATGYNVVDIKATSELGIVVTNVPGYSTESVAQMVFAHLLTLCQHVAEHSRGVRAGKWEACEDFCYWDFPVVELQGKTIGIVGFGKIGRAVARIARAFGMRVLVCGRRKIEDLLAGAEFVELETLLKKSDVVTLHCPLTEQTERMINAESICLMKEGAFLINTGRGGLVDEGAVADALNEGRLGGMGTDTLSSEPPRGDNPLLSARNCYITPHIAWASIEARQRLMDVVVDNCRAYLAGRSQNVVNG